MSESSRSALLSLKGPWSRDELEQYLLGCKTPLRVSCQTPYGYPALVSLWFLWRDDAFWCVTHEFARILNYLHRDERVAFEVANNHPPYYGVRGHGVMELFPAAGGKLLESLIDKYLGGEDSGFTRWLLSRREQEYALCLRPLRLSVWDYRQRMTGSEQEEHE